jgi:hypothetical protein
LLPFDPKKSVWRVWSKQFLARAQIKGFYKVLIGEEVPISDRDFERMRSTRGAEYEETKRIREMNAKAYNDLLLSFSDVVNFGLLEDSVTLDLKGGDAALAWKKLNRKHDPSTKANMVQLQRQFADSVLTDVKKDPEEWISELEVLRRRLKTCGDDMDDTRFIVHIITNLPEEYEAVTDLIEVELEQAYSTLDLEDVRERLRNKYQKMKSRWKASSGKSQVPTTRASGKSTEEKALAAGVTKGKCWTCGKYGHKSRNCTEKRQESGTSTSTSENTKYCGYCKKHTNHTIEDCYKRKNAEKKKQQQAEKANAATENEEAMVTIEYCNAVQDEPNYWIGDSGATSHMTNSTDWLTEIEDIDVNVKLGDGSIVKATKKGKYHGTAVQKDGTTSPILLTDVKYIPVLKSNLLSITTAISNGWAIGNEGKVITLSKNGTVIKFDHVKPSGSGNTAEIEIVPNVEFARAAGEVTTNREKMDVNELHRLLGHPGERKTRATGTGDSLNLELTGKFETCEDCVKGKAKQKNIEKFAEKKSTKPFEKIYVDISTITATSVGGKKNWVLIVDEFTNMKWSLFIKNKSDFPSEMLNFIKKISSQGFNVETIRLDNSGENTKFQELMVKNNFGGVQFEFTAPRTPQQNGVVERAFATLMGRMRAMMSSAGLSTELRALLWAECARTATMLENSISDTNQGAPIKRFYGEQYKWFPNLKQFGTMAVLTTRTPNTGKLDDRGTTCIFVGYTDDHPSDTYRFINLSTNKLILSRDCRWLNKTYGQYINPREPTQEVGNIEELLDFEVPDGTNQAETPTAADLVEIFEQGGNEDEIKDNTELLYLLCVENSINKIIEEPVTERALSAVTSTSDEPQTFTQAWHHTDPIKQVKYREAVQKEFRDMISKGVWRVVSRRDIPKDRKAIGTKWVFKEKKNGVYRARLVGLGYSQIPGVDFTENYAAVANDITFRILLVIYLLYNYDSKVIDVETAFLYGDLEEEIYMQIPQGYKECIDSTVGTDQVLKLDKAIYGLVQAARQWWKKISDFFMYTLKFTRSLVDPCLFYRTNEKGTVYLCLYVDDILCIGDTEAINFAVEEVQKTYKIKDMGRMHEYVGCTVTTKDNKIILSQPDIIKKLEANFGEEVKGLSTYRTPSAPHQVLVQPSTDALTLSTGDQKKYRSGVGTLLYLVKHSRPDLSNSVRELSKMMDLANEAHKRALLRTIKYVLDTKNLYLNLKPTAINLQSKWKITGVCDSDYAGDRDTRRSVSGYVVYVNDAIIAWKSKGQRTVTLSSTEAEYIAVTDLCTEVLFVKMLLETMGLEVELPIKIYADNVGAMFLAENASVGQRTKHIDVRYHFIRDLVQNGTLQIIFIKTTDNDADIYTKNVSGEVFEKHISKYMELSAT